MSWQNGLSDRRKSLRRSLNYVITPLSAVVAVTNLRNVFRKFVTTTAVSLPRPASSRTLHRPGRQRRLRSYRRESPSLSPVRGPNPRHRRLLTASAHAPPDEEENVRTRRWNKTCAMLRLYVPPSAAASIAASTSRDGSGSGLCSSPHLRACYRLHPASTDFPMPSDSANDDAAALLVGPVPFGTASHRGLEHHPPPVLVALARSPPSSRVAAVLTAQVRDTRALTLRRTRGTYGRCTRLSTALVAGPSIAAASIAASPATAAPHTQFDDTGKARIVRTYNVARPARPAFLEDASAFGLS
ncbi:hypothetical protein HYPSUDRAFT_206878 [Hypholoma sublateritium FD-334 SS-4]|uniref:Uncharacterized protein n=1 Tax=Hypholoma sublateritium (strain FD-334 SS-4) TaxID=945553 RepID=A0A0D2P8A2_HYPSF|nr:hypothetical protein HYPSUDRAFT_206878 [Hypholoma sublateritium FD-334 SS-4]